MNFRGRFLFLLVVMAIVLLIANLLEPLAINNCIKLVDRIKGHEGSGDKNLSLNRSRNATLFLKAFGAKCDGSTDDARAINAWLSSAATKEANIELVAPAGVCAFDSAVATPPNAVSSNINLHGAGPNVTTFLYRGRKRDIDLLSFGDGTAPLSNWSIHDFRVASETKMLSGVGLHVRGMTRSSIGNIVLDGQDGNGNLWNAVWFDQIDSISTWGHSYATGQHEALMVSGGKLGGADLSLIGWKIAPTNNNVVPEVGVHIGGGFGGFVCGSGSDIIGNGTNLIVDNTLDPETNREIFFGSGCFIDSSSIGPGVEVNDQKSAPGDLYISFSGGWIASSKTNNLQLDPEVNGHIVFSGGTIFNAFGSGIYDRSKIIQNYTGVLIRANGRGNAGGYGYYSTSDAKNASFFGVNFLDNSSGSIFTEH